MCPTQNYRGFAFCPRGFSLLEILLVLLIVGLGSAGVMLSIDGRSPDREIHQTIDRFGRQAQLALDEAALSGETLGLMLFPADAEHAAYSQWYRQRDAEWQADAELFIPVRMPEAAAVVLEVEGELLTWPQEETAQPVALAFASGEATSFWLTLESTDASAWRQVRIGANGELRYRNSGTETY